MSIGFIRGFYLRHHIKNYVGRGCLCFTVSVSHGAVQLTLERSRDLASGAGSAAAKLAMTKGISLAVAQCRRLTIACRYGWDTLKQYEQAELAQGETPEALERDSKRLRSAHKAAVAARPLQRLRTRKDWTKEKCFKCGKLGHSKKRCPSK